MHQSYHYCPRWHLSSNNIYVSDTDLYNTGRESLIKVRTVWDWLILPTSSAGDDDPLLLFLTSWLVISLVIMCDLFSLLADCTGDLVCWLDDLLAIGLAASSGEDRRGGCALFLDSAKKHNELRMGIVCLRSNDQDRWSSLVLSVSLYILLINRSPQSK